jgi:CRISPR-associated protein Cmr1
MGRKLPTVTAPESVTPNLQAKRVKGNDVALIRQTREYELITPLFGGGTETQKADPVSVIRVPSIRGQLRFWWRAIRGGQFGGSMEKMKEREDEIFGAASVGDKANPSQVQIDLTVTNLGKDLSLVTNYKGKQVHISDISSPYGYAAFPLREKKLGTVVNVSFSIFLSYPASITPEIEAALWAWEMFGGIGGRTRRGFGSLQQKSYKPTVGSVQKNIEDGLTKHLAGNTFPPSVPHLINNSTSIKITSPHNNVPDVWEYLIGELKKFRQDRPWNSTKNKPSRSNWHEPDAIRNLTSYAKYHPPKSSNVNKFPRAAFGLPIIFKFSPNDVPNGDPQETTLEGKDESQKRMASPLILRSLACANNQAVGLAVILSGTSLPPSGIILSGAPGNPAVRADLTSTEASSIAPLGGNADVLQAFLDKLK